MKVHLQLKTLIPFEFVLYRIGKEELRLTRNIREDTTPQSALTHRVRIAGDAE